jgi:hypothetical protein
MAPTAEPKVKLYPARGRSCAADEVGAAAAEGMAVMVVVGAQRATAARSDNIFFLEKKKLTTMVAVGGWKRMEKREEEEEDGQLFVCGRAHVRGRKVCTRGAGAMAFGRAFPRSQRGLGSSSRCSGGIY